MTVKINDLDENIREIVLNRPEKRNAMSEELLRALIDALEDSKKRRAVILRGEGKIFCSGLDLEETSRKKDIFKLVACALEKIYLAPFFTVCAVQGAALAGGAALMLACDYSLGQKGAKFGFPEIKRGLIPAMALNILLRKICGKEAEELLLTGSLIDVKRAYSIGLINDMVEDNEALLSRTREIVAGVLEASPQALRLTKELMRRFYPDFSREQCRALSYHDKIQQTGEPREGIAAFLEKRKPRWRKL